jgi:hypothetical protein
MKFLKLAVLLLGIWVCLSGLLFAAQGTGIFPYPRSSLMISQTVWVYRGLGIAVIGAIIAALSRKI